MDTDAQWEAFGRSDPYFGVYSQDRFRGRELDADRRAEFFASGERHVAAVLGVVREQLDPDFTPKRVLDFGCGVGRLALPFAAGAEEVVGVDVSPSMLAEGRRNAEQRDVGNVRYVGGLDEAGGEFDLVHTYAVLQHIPTDRGRQFIRQMLGKVRPGGLAALHFTYRRTGSTLARTAYAAAKRSALASRLANIARGRSWREPVMQVNEYDVGLVLRSLCEAGFGTCHAAHVAQRRVHSLFLFARHVGPTPQAEAFV